MYTVTKLLTNIGDNNLKATTIIQETDSSMQTKANKSNYERNSDILHMLLEGKTCEPISLKEFHAFLKYKERSIENLEFYQWFQRYKLKFANLPVEQRDLCLTARTLERRSSLTGKGLASYTEQSVMSRKSGETPQLSPTIPNFQEAESFDAATLVGMKRNSSGSTLLGTPLASKTNSIITVNPGEKSSLRIDDSTFVDLDLSTGDLFAQAFAPDSPFFKDLNPNDLQLTSLPPATTRSSLSSYRSTIIQSAQIVKIYLPSQTRFQRKNLQVIPSPITIPYNLVTSTSVQPFRNEVDQIIRTYLTADAAKELNIPSTMRKSVIRFATQTTHPSIFEPVVRYVYNLMRQNSLRNFMKDAVQNVDSCARWNLIRKSSFAFSLTLGILLPMILFGISRWWRLLAFPFLYIGTAYLIGARKRFCFQRYALRERVLKPYEINATENGLEIGDLTGDFSNFTDKIKSSGEGVKNAVAGKVLDPIIEEMQGKIVRGWIVGVALTIALGIQVAVMLVPEKLV
ncbi:303_t:CDS:2 [Ambispora gerdemannii]|uniref:303_t:CDS:1 n=1 Tax=Ambispora gerdemannii TaxID=144530 RepID=A0A9N9BXG0_9GLOM|nr:303_t:CDS:2 [Ambispora gerdemannii]